MAMTPDAPGMQAPQARPFGADADMVEDDPEGDIEATPEEQADYDLVVARAYKFIYGEGKDQTLKTLSSGENPADGIGRATAMILRAIKVSADQSGKKIEGDILFHAAAELAEDLSEFGKTAKVFEFRDEDEDVQQTQESLFYAMKYYGEEAMANGEIDQEEAQRAVQQGIQQEQQAASANVGDAVRQELPGGQPPAPPPMRGMVNSVRGA